jgi:hypothetical protein
MLWELHKVSGPKTILFILVVLLLFNGINLVKNHAPLKVDAASLSKGRQQISRQIEGELTEERLGAFYKKCDESQALIDGGDFDTTNADFDRFYTGFAFGDNTVYQEIRAEVDRLRQYGEYAKETKTDAENNMVRYGEKSRLLYDENKMIAVSFDSRSITEYAYSAPVINLFTYNFSSVLILLMLLFLLCPFYCVEKESAMLPIMLVTRNGRKKRGTEASKLLTAVCIISACVLVFSVQDFIGLKLCYGFRGMFQPIYALSEFSKTYFECSVFSFWLIALALKWLSFLIFGAVFLLLSKLVKSQSAVFLLSLFFLIGMISLAVFYPLTSRNTAELLNPVSLILSYKEFGKFSFISFFGMPVLRSHALIASGVLLCFALYAILLAVPLNFQIKIKRGFCNALNRR